MKVLIAGAGGQVGRALLETAPDAVACVGCGHKELDIEDRDAILRTLERLRPDVVMNAVAYTAVDKAETDSERAFAVNADAAGLLAAECRSMGARLVHISTDFVFDGRASQPYAPSDATGAINVYGASKLEGERRVIETGGLNWLIFRTAWVYASVGRNFLLTMLRLFQARESVSVVCDQVGTPTSAKSLARALWQALQSEGPSEVLHYTDAGVASWYDFAVAIHEEARTAGLIERDVDIVPITTAQYPTPARRPAYSVLDKTRTLQRVGIRPVHWRVALREIIKELS